MSQLITRFEHVAQTMPDAPAFSNSSGQSIAYGALDQASTRLAAFFARMDGPRQPVVVYGHKAPTMLVCFLACMKSGRAYVPVDSIYPTGRIASILEQLGSVPVVATMPDDDGSIRQAAAEASCFVDCARLEEVLDEPLPQGWPADELSAVEGDDALYILFTSGSTGKPKGVQMSAGAIDDFMGYMTGVFGASGPGQVMFNRVPYTFDVSVFDMVVALSSGAEMFSLDSPDEQSMAATFDALSASGLTVWVSTPSFVEACLADPAFGAGLLGSMHTMVLCGEALRNSTASAILERFEGLRLVNTYGPTETQAVTDIVVDAALLEECDPLPVGFLNPSVRATIREPLSLALLPEGQEGEVFLDGATLATCYRNAPDLTSKAFLVLDDGEGGKVRTYRTGDKGRIDDQGRLFCLGRLDFQVKVNGFRVELPEIEEHLCALDEVSQACVLPVQRNGQVAFLRGFVLLADRSADTSFAMTKLLKQKLAQTLPPYMVPRTFVYVDGFPTNANGKIDRKALAAMEDVG